MISSAGWTAKDVPDQSNKRILITGASSGIGLETARELAQRGAHVVLACRNQNRAEIAVAEIRNTTPDASLEVGIVDLASLSSVRTFAEDLIEVGQPVDVLINNAGIMAVPFGWTKDGFELQFGTNHLGHFALTGLILDLLLASDQPRIVNVSSLAHKIGRLNFDNLQAELKYKRFGAYAQSKLANLVFTMALERRFRRVGLQNALAVACHPGMSATNLGAGVSSVMWEKATKAQQRFKFSSQSAADGAIPTLRAATDPNAKGGDYFGPAKFGETRGPAVKVKAKPKAYDIHDARALWDLSVVLTKVRYPQLEPL